MNRICTCCNKRKVRASNYFLCTRCQRENPDGCQFLSMDDVPVITPEEAAIVSRNFTKYMKGEKQVPVTIFSSKFMSQAELSALVPSGATNE